MKLAWRVVFAWALLCAFGVGAAEAQPSPSPELGSGNAKSDPDGSEAKPRADSDFRSAPKGAEGRNTPGKSRTEELWHKLYRLMPEHPANRVELATLRSVPMDGLVGTRNRARTFSVGEDIVFGLRAMKPCHLLLLNFGTSKTIAVLIPHANRQSTELSGKEPNKTHHWTFMPNRLLTEAYRFPVGGPPGRELAKAICTREKLDLSMLGEMPEEGFLAIKPGQNNDGLERLIKNLEGMDWAEASVPIEVVETR